MLVGKKILGWKKNVGRKISPAIPKNVQTFPGLQDQRRKTRKKKILGPRLRDKKMYVEKK